MAASVSAGSSRKKTGLVVIGAGLGRTGTDSLRDALALLLGGRCYHMFDIIAGGDAEVSKWVGSSRPDWDAIFDARTDGWEYLAAVDYPACCYVEELMKRYPNAMVVLSKRRNAEDWVKSAKNTIIWASKVIYWINIFTFKLIPNGAMFAELTRRMYLDTLGFEARHSTHEKLLEAYERHNAHIEAVVPKERLIIHTVGDGWEPLCKALKLPIPSEPYPNKNNSDAFEKRFNKEIRTKLPRNMMSWRGLLVVAIYVAAGAAAYFGGKILLREVRSNPLPLSFLGFK